jgi:AhpD family alkylhydroperoxidase
MINCGLAPQALRAMADAVTDAATDAGLDRSIFELVKIRASQLNGCAGCLDMHTADAVKLGEDPRRIFLLDAWRDTELFTGQERAVLELTETLTRLAQTQGVPDDVFDRAMSVLTEAQYRAVAWMIVVINSFNRLSVSNRVPLTQGDHHSHA